MTPDLNVSRAHDLCALRFRGFNCTEVVYRPAARAALLSALLVFVAVNLIGNAAVIASVLYFRQLQTRANALALSLACTDILVGAVVMPLSAVREAYTCWFYGHAACRLHTWLDYSLTTSSVAHLACVAADRSVAIGDPLRYRERVTPAAVALMVGLCWLSLAGYAVPILAFWPTVMVPEPCPDNCNVEVNVEYAMANTVCAYALPLSVMVAVYARIYAQARAQSRKIKALAMPVAVAASGDRPEAPSWKAMRREHNATLTLGTLGGVFVLCWVPYFIASSAESFLGTDAAILLVDVANWFTYVNSTINPVLIMLLNRSFRGALKATLSGRVFTRKCRESDLLDWP
ncbi:trace amine-associated receptor 365-like [Petromyzon marinus]|uniref:5-hydroxytryptamine receptor 1A-like n=1 Tax=Petromyzon marinus TaxID=7757 RepID=A0AAJ7TCG0_PETMA|nr:5-hydroxytryptamine receptor 1A-like [Petromyzon marinus]